MKLLNLSVLLFLLMISTMAVAQRGFNTENLTYCQRTGKAIYMYNANLVKLGMVMPQSEIGVETDATAAGFTNEGLLGQFAFMRYFDLDINRSRFGIGYYSPIFASYNPWQSDSIAAFPGLKIRPYLFVGAGIGPLFSMRLVDRLLLDVYATAQPSLSFYGGFKHNNNEEEYKEYSFIAFNLGAMIGASLRYRFLIVGCDWLPLKQRYNTYSYLNDEATELSPEKRQIDVGRVSVSLGVYF
ncbi:MAG: hypothetical protein GXY94_07340 [Bacteroidales bacterium]|nr:hypothetical protein [Bacteroidales bacterium]